MKTLKLIALAAFALLFSQCKSPTQAVKGPTPSLFEVTQILDSTQSKFLAYSTQNNGNPHLSIMQTASWVQSQPNVQSAKPLDSIYIMITLKSGLQATFSFDETDSAGYTFTQGGDRSEKLEDVVLSPSSTLSKNTITNKKVLIYCAGCDDFDKSGDIFDSKAELQNSSLGLDVTFLRDAECTYQMVDNFKDYGLVIIDTHGSPDAFLVGSTVLSDNSAVSDDLFKASIVKQGGQDLLDKLLSGALSFHDRVKGNTLQPYWKKAYPPRAGFYLFVTTKYIDALPPMPGTVVFGGMCYSGQSAPTLTGNTPIKTAWMNKNLISYYGFAHNDGSSGPVYVPFCFKMIDSVVHALVTKIDSTGKANLASDNTEFYDPFALLYDGLPVLYNKHFGADDYSYPKPCGDSLVDSRDGHKYATVCIGNQQWMAENLDYDVPGALCYNSDAANCLTYGKLYDYTTLMNGAQPSTHIPSGVRGVCPQGWHVPSDSEFRIMVKFLGGTDFGGGAVGGMLKSTSSLWKSPNTGATNSSGFSALPAGDGVTSSLYENIGKDAEFNTSTATVAPTYIAPTIYTLDASSNLITPGVLGDAARSCRCVKDP